MDDIVVRLRVNLADAFYAGEITSAALTEKLNLERQEAANLIEKLRNSHQGASGSIAR